MSNRELEIAKEIEEIALAHNISTLELIEQYKKAHNSTDQSKSYELNKTINDIIPPGTDIDNDQIYIKETGEVLKDLN
ncbi:hypothetical protein ACQPVP_15900 [Clostridium nigeriense]|uniref:hypothetical protein n=1 Tax=Clostridium nigeriense TaxID=1805470 RepID=UPI003D348DFF